jgi:hypothetical protein
MARLFGALGVFLAALVASFCTPSSAQDAYLTRIEPRPFYGATVTIEEGVRVFRPLPATRHMIINPNRTPLNLAFSDTVERQSGRDNSGDGSIVTSDGYADNNKSSYSDIGGSSDGFYGDHGYSAGYGAKGKRLRGFVPPHGVRVNGQHTAVYASSSVHHAPKGHAGPQKHRKAVPHPGRQHPASHGFVYGSGKTASRPVHLPPIGYGAPRHSYAQRYPIPNVNVHRPMMQFPMRSHGPVISHTPMRPPVMMAPPIQSYRPLPAPVPMQAAPAAAPAHANHGHAAPAGRMGMGMGQGRGR